jgi:hypothetical protein
MISTILRLDTIITMSDQIIICILQMLFGFIVFFSIRYAIGRNLNETETQCYWPYIRGDLVKATRISLAMVSSVYMLTNVILASLLTWEIESWIPSLFQQIMFIQYIVEFCLLLLFKSAFSSRYVRFLAMHHSLCLAMFIIWFCLLSSKTIVVYSIYDLGLLVNVWGLSVIGPDMYEVWLYSAKPNSSGSKRRGKLEAMVGSIVSRALQIILGVMAYSYSFAWSHETQGNEHPKVWIMFTIPAVLMNGFDAYATFQSVKRTMKELHHLNTTNNNKSVTVV